MKISKETRKFILATLSGEDRKQFLAQVPLEDRLAGLTLEVRLAGLTPEEVEQLVEKVSLERRLVGLTRDEMQKLLTQIKAFLQQNAADKESSPSA